MKGRKYNLVKTEEELKSLSTKLVGKSQLAFDWETVGVKFWEDEFIPLGLALAYNDLEGWYIPLNHTLPSGGSLFGINGAAQINQVPSLSIEALKKHIYPVLLQAEVLVAHNFKYDAQVNERFGMPLWNLLRDNKVYDTYIAAALTNDTRSKVSLKALAREWLGIDATEIKELDDGADLTEVPIELVTEYAIDDACNTLALKTFTEEKLAQSRHLSDLFWKLEMPIIEAVAKMETIGIKVDKTKLKEVDEWARWQMKCALKKLRELSGFPFDPGKTEHVGTILYDKLGLPPSRSKGKDNADRKQIKIHFDLLDPERKKKAAPFVKAYLAYKDALKVHNTYAQPLIDRSYKSRVHPTFLQCNVETGRFASKNPNFQNIIKTSGGLDVRQGLVPDCDMVLVFADYQRVEFLIASSFSKDPTLITAARNPDVDVHAHTARGVFKLQDNQTPTSEQRDKAKTGTYGILYGVTKEGLAKQLAMSVYDSNKFIKNFYKTYTGLREWQEATSKFILANGYSQTYFGRRRYANKEKLLEGDRLEKEGELRQLLNNVIQGTSADITKLALKKCYKTIQDQQLDTRIIGQIHDELIFLTPYSEIVTVYNIAKEHMPFTLFPGKENEVTLGIDVEIKTSMSKDKKACVSDEFLEKWAPEVLNARSI